MEGKLHRWGDVCQRNARPYNAALKYFGQEPKSLKPSLHIERSEAKGLPDIGELNGQAWFEADLMGRFDFPR